MSSTEAKIRSAIADCDRYITTEEARSADLRPKDVQHRLAWYKQHKANLEKMLAEGSWRII